MRTLDDKSSVGSRGSGVQGVQWVWFSGFSGFNPERIERFFQLTIGITEVARKPWTLTTRFPRGCRHRLLRRACLRNRAADRAAAAEQDLLNPLNPLNPLNLQKIV